VLGREGAGGAGREDDVWLEMDKLLREDRLTFLLPFSPLVPDDEILSFHVAELTEALTKGVDLVRFEGGRRVTQIWTSSSSRTKVSGGDQTETPIFSHTH